MKNNQTALKQIQEYYDKEHKRNKERIRYGIAAMIFVPVIFLILMFCMNSSKVIYLILWIASLFLISGYLISIEYKDYTMSENLKGLIQHSADDSLIDRPGFIFKSGGGQPNERTEQ